ncbi:MAG: putative Ig domain-containing protein, partial [Lysobacter sp.]
FGVTNTAPTATAIPNQSVGRNVAFNYPVTPFFSDVNGASTLTYTASGLPAGMTCSATGVVTGTPASSVPLGDYVVTVTATDSGNASVASNFTLSVQNSTPVAPATIADQTAIAGTAWFFQFPAFVDPNQDTLTYTFTGAPAWMGFDQNTRALVGTPGPVGSWTITIKATDTSGAWAVKTFTVTTPNAAPGVATAIPTQGVGRNVAWNYTIPNGTFSDANGDPLTITLMSGLPAGISFNGSSFSGTPTVLGSSTLIVRASDGRGGTVDTSFVLNVVNHPPVYNGGLPNRAANQGQSVSWTLPQGSFTDPNGDGLQYSLLVEIPEHDERYWFAQDQVWDSRTVPAAWVAASLVGLSVDANSGTVSGTPTVLYVYRGEGVASDVVVNYSVRIVATDPSGAAAAGAFSTAINRLPTSYDTNETVFANTPFSRSLRGFSDADGDGLTFSATMVGGAALPSWLSLSNAVLSGTAPSIASYQLQVTAREPSGATTTAVVTINAVNSGPSYAVGVVPSTLSGNATVAFDYQLPANAFTDPNGDALSYSAYLLRWVPDRTDGEGYVEPAHWSQEALPSWLFFNTATRTLSSTAPVQGTYEIEFVAQDGAGASASVNTTLTIGAAPNVAPSAPTLSNQSAGRNQFWSYTVPAFSDPNGDPLAYSAGALPAGVSFNASTRTFSGSPSALGTSTLTVTANDGRGGVTNASFTLTVSNTAPVAPSIATQTTTAGVAWGYTIPAFTDPNGDALTYAASGLPAWMSFTAGSRYLSGMPSTVGSWTITVTATDTNNASASTSFTVSTPNRAPTVANGLPNHTIGKGQNWSYQVPSGTFADANNDTLTYSASGMPAGIGFDIGTRTFTGAATALGAYTVTVYADDGRGGVMGTNFTLTVGNSAPVYSIGLPNRAANQNEAVAWTLAAGSFTDANNEPLSYSVLVERPAFDELYWNAQDGAWDTRPRPAAWVAASDAGLSINAGNGTLSGNVQPLTASGQTFYSYRVKLIATDPNGATAEGTFFASINAGPTPSSVPTQTARQNLGYGYQVPAFSDPNGDPLYYWTGALPPGIAFDAGTRVLSGTPTVPGNYSVTVAAHDGRGLSTSTTFAFNVQANNAPVAPTIPNQLATVGVGWSYTVPAFSDADADPLSYSASNMPPGIAFDAGSRVLSGTPSTAGSYTVTVTANDGRGGVTSTSFVISVTNAPPANRAPVLTAALEEQYATSGMYFEYTFAANTFTDPDGNALTYTAATADGATWPGWLTFNGPSRSFSGTPGGLGSQGWTIRVTATDPSGLSTFGDFYLSKEGSGGGGGGNQMQAQSSES